MRLLKNHYIKLALASMLILGGIGAYTLSTGQTMTVEAITPTTAAVQPTNPASNGGAVTSRTTPQPSATPNCQKTTYAQLPAPSVNAQQAGLHSNVLPASSYAVYGNTIGEINNQMNDCSPVGSDGDHFAASTDYAINWAFDYQGDDDGLCHVTSASVGLNVAVIYPNWHPTGGAAPAVNASWQRFITNLTAHENGHVQIDQAGATQLLSDLQNFPASSCDTIIAQVTARANADIQAISQANDSYDSVTGHGATQGAVLN